VRNRDNSTAVVATMAMVLVIRRRVANQFRKSGMVLSSQPCFARIMRASVELHIMYQFSER
jgi:hypothetical protein